MADFTPTPSDNTSPYEGGLGPEFEALLHRIDEREARPGTHGVISRLIGMDVDEYLAADKHAAEARNEWRKDTEAQRGLKALMLAPTLVTCRALLRGERIPWQLLNYFQAKRYGLRGRTSSDHRYGLDDFNDVRRP